MALTADYIKYLEEQGYVQVREIPERGICALRKFMYTTGIVYGLDDSGYKGRWCYASMPMAVVAFSQWDGVGDPPMDWIKYKGVGGERSRTEAN
jgi:hypothetical protein